MNYPNPFQTSTLSEHDGPIYSLQHFLSSMSVKVESDVDGVPESVLSFIDALADLVEEVVDLTEWIEEDHIVEYPSPAVRCKIEPDTLLQLVAASSPRTDPLLVHLQPERTLKHGRSNSFDLHNNDSQKRARICDRHGDDTASDECILAYPYANSGYGYIPPFTPLYMIQQEEPSPPASTEKPILSDTNCHRFISSPNLDSQLFEQSPFYLAFIATSYIRKHQPFPEGPLPSLAPSVPPEVAGTVEDSKDVELLLGVAASASEIVRPTRKTRRNKVVGPPPEHQPKSYLSDLQGLKTLDVPVSEIGRPLPVAVPNLSKKARGRTVVTVDSRPTAPLPKRAARAKETSPAQSATEADKGRKFLCVAEGCGKLFVRGEHMKRHVRSIHTYETPHACTRCEKSFSRVDNLKHT